MVFAVIVIGTLAVWRATYMLQEEKGPLGIFAKLQAWFWTDPVRVGGLKDGLRCFNCTSVWLAFFAALIIEHSNLGLFILYWFAISAGAMIIGKLYNLIEQ